jgi:hypothetical protein
MAVSIKTENALYEIMQDILGASEKYFSKDRPSELAKEIYEEFTEDKSFPDEILEEIMATCYTLAEDTLN